LTRSFYKLDQRRGFPLAPAAVPTLSAPPLEDLETAMSIFIRTASAAAVLLTCSGAAFAVPYALPSGPDIAQAKLSGPIPGTYAVVCDSRTGVPCDVEPGTYQLQTFDQTWRVSTRNVVVSAGGPTDGGATRTLVSESCVRDDEDDEPQRCTATCPSGTTATGGSCLAQLQFRVGDELEEPRVVPSGSLAGETSHSCVAMIDLPGGLDVILFNVSVHCE